MENQDELLKLMVKYLQENQRAIERIAENVRADDHSFVRRITSRNDILLQEIEKLAQIPIEKPTI